MANKRYPNIACSEINMANALYRYLKYVLCFDKILINPLNDPFRYKDAVEIAEQSEFLIIDAFINEEPKGFHFARQMAKKSLLLFYSGELDIDMEGPFWLVLPEKLYKLKEKITDITKKPQITDKKYLDLENKYPLLKEFKSHHF